MYPSDFVKAPEPVRTSGPSIPGCGCSCGPATPIITGGAAEAAEGVLVALRAAIRRREIWVEGASQWRNPEADLPADVEASRDVHYQALGNPRDPAAFIAGGEKRHAVALGRLNNALAPGKHGRGDDHHPAW
jgi:hypothetical protein